MEEKGILEWLFDDDIDAVQSIPLRPVGPAVFVLEKRTPDMLADGWKWKVAGSCRRPVRQPLYRKSMYYYHGRDGVEKSFQRQVFERLDDEGRVVIKYSGTPVCPVAAPHGNSGSDRPYVRTNPSVLAKIKEVISASGDQAGPAKLYKEAVRSCTADDDQRTCPRDIKQVCNIVQGVRDQQRLGRDGIVNVLRRLSEVNYIHVMEATPDNLCVVVGMPDLVRDFCELHRSSTPVVYYDTTFSMGDFYVSALLYRHSVFEGSPVIPLLMLVHERRTTESHELLFKWFVRLTGAKNVICIVDREQSITNAIRTVLPEAVIHYCWNHLLGDIRMWIKNHGGTVADETFYTTSVRQLLTSEDHDAYHALLNGFTERWSPPFLDYYSRNLEEAVETSALFATQNSGVMSVPYVGITNNVSESYNRVLKDFQNWKERPIDVVVDGFAHLQQYHINEIGRGLAGTGTYRLRPGFPSCSAMPPMVTAFAVDPANLVKTLQNPSAEVNQERPPEPAKESLSDVAHAHLLSSRVQFHDGVWLVNDNVRMHKTFLVSLADKSCSCAFKDCIHLEAVRVANGLPTGKKRGSTTLAALRRTQRFGRKQGRKRRLDSSEQCAPDSVQAKRFKDMGKNLTPIPERQDDDEADLQNVLINNNNHSRKLPFSDDKCVNDNPSASNGNFTSQTAESAVENVIDGVHEPCHSGISTPVPAGRCRKSLFVDSTAEKADDIEPIAWTPAHDGFQTAAADVIRSPGEECAITDVLSGKSPASLISTHGRWLTGSDVDAVQEMLRRQWDGDGLVSTTSEFTKPLRRPFIQVLFSPVRGHWLTVYGSAKSVTVFDSLHNSKPSQTTQDTIRRLAGKSVRIRYCKSCTLQTLPGDCGPFALAYAITRVLGADPASYEYVAEDVRTHLAHCVRTREFVKFPYVHHCVCDGRAGGRMVACDACARWFHLTCVADGKIAKDAQWMCDSCK